MQLIDALRYKQGTCVAFVGAGGKTTALFRLAKEIAAKSRNAPMVNTVVVTTTTHLGAWQAAFADHVIRVTSLIEISQLKNRLPKGIVLFSGEEENNLLGGLTKEQIRNLNEFTKEYNLSLLIEADGAHLHPLKAPAAHEPVIPDFVEDVIVVSGLLGLGKPLTKEWVHRPERFAALAGLNLGDVVNGNALVNVLLHQEGGLKGIPPGARKIVLLNQADTQDLLTQATMISARLIPSYRASIISTLSKAHDGLSSPAREMGDQNNGIHAVIEPIAAIILAAGESSRFGQPKQLLSWQGQSMIRHIANTAINAGLSPVVVVVGSSAPDISAVIKDLPLRIVNNKAWRKGVSSSVKMGLKSIPEPIGAAIFLQGDQPQIPSSLIRSMVEVHQSTMSPIIAPQINGQRGNPVLFDRCTFTDLLSLKGDVGGRVLLSHYPVQWVNWKDENLLLDIDTLEDYQKLVSLYPKKQGLI